MWAARSRRLRSVAIWPDLARSSRSCAWCGAIAVTVARSLSDTFAGIRPLDVAPFAAAQLAGAIAATFLFRWLVPSLHTTAKEILVPDAPNGR